MTSFTREECNTLHRLAEQMPTPGMRSTMRAKADSREAKRRMDRHSAAVANTVKCQNAADRYFARLNERLQRAFQ